MASSALRFPQTDRSFQVEHVALPCPEAVLSALAEIEVSTEQTETGGRHKFAWGRAALAETLAMPGSGLSIAVEPDSRTPLAFCLYRTVVDELEILQVATARTAQRRGAASSLLRYTLAEARKTPGCICFLEVRASNHAAHRLYESLGFAIVGTRRAYYSDPTEDALLMRLD